MIDASIAEFCTAAAYLLQSDSCFGVCNSLESGRMLQHEHYVIAPQRVLT